RPSIRSHSDEGLLLALRGVRELQRAGGQTLARHGLVAQAIRRIPGRANEARRRVEKFPGDQGKRGAHASAPADGRLFAGGVRRAAAERQVQDRSARPGTQTWTGYCATLDFQARRREGASELCRV